jgi:hypothetical protein
MYSVCFKKKLAKRFHPSKFDIQYSIFGGLLFRPAAKVAGLIIKKTVPFWRSFTRAPPLAASVQSDQKRNFRTSNIEH